MIFTFVTEYILGKLLRKLQPELMDALIQASKDGDQSRLQALCGSVSWANGDEEEEEEETEHEEEEEVIHIEFLIIMHFLELFIKRDKHPHVQL